MHHRKYAADKNMDKSIVGDANEIYTVRQGRTLCEITMAGRLFLFLKKSESNDMENLLLAADAHR